MNNLINISAETAESMLKKTFYIVEADDFAQHELWARYCRQSNRVDRRDSDRFTNWEQCSPGWLVTVSELHGRPICISVCWFRINGEYVMFYYPTSELVDHARVEEWLKENYKVSYYGRRAQCDARNFHQCLDAILEANATRPTA